MILKAYIILFQMGSCCGNSVKIIKPNAYKKRNNQLELKDQITKQQLEVN